MNESTLDELNTDLIKEIKNNDFVPLLRLEESVRIGTIGQVNVDNRT